MMKRIPVLLALALVLTTLVGCAKSLKLVYKPNPTDVSEPGETFRRLIMTSSWTRPVRVDVEKSYASMIFANNGQVTTVTLTFSEVANIQVWRKEGKNDFWVDCEDMSGKRIYSYFAPNQRAAYQFADVVAFFVKVNKK